jgi:hypothetical protein
LRAWLAPLREIGVARGIAHEHRALSRCRLAF